jgi:hypothetical protein
VICDDVDLQVEECPKMSTKYWKCQQNTEEVNEILKMSTKYWKWRQNTENVNKILKMATKYWRCRQNTENGDKILKMWTKYVLKMLTKYWRCAQMCKEVRCPPQVLGRVRSGLVRVGHLALSTIWCLQFDVYNLMSTIWCLQFDVDILYFDILSFGVSDCEQNLVTTL